MHPGIGDRERKAQKGHGDDRGGLYHDGKARRDRIVVGLYIVFIGIVILSSVGFMICLVAFVFSNEVNFPGGTGVTGPAVLVLTGLFVVGTVFIIIGILTAVGRIRIGYFHLVVSLFMSAGCVLGLALNLIRPVPVLIPFLIALLVFCSFVVPITFRSIKERRTGRGQHEELGTGSWS